MGEISNGRTSPLKVVKAKNKRIGSSKRRFYCFEFPHVKPINQYVLYDCDWCIINSIRFYEIYKQNRHETVESFERQQNEKKISWETIERNVEQIGNQRQCKTKKTYC